jgi:hypothetical protein
MGADREDALGEGRGLLPEALLLAEDLGRVDADQPDLADAAEPQRVAVGVLGDGRFVGLVRPAPERMRVGPAAGERERGG